MLDGGAVSAAWASAAEEEDEMSDTFSEMVRLKSVMDSR